MRAYGSGEHIGNFSDKMEGSINLPLLLFQSNIGKLKSEAVCVTRCGGVGIHSTLISYLLSKAGVIDSMLNETSDTEPEGAE